jgi:hypothetical protein
VISAYKALRMGWNDAVAALPPNELVGVPYAVKEAYEVGRLLVAELRGAAENGEQAPRAWLEGAPQPPDFKRACALYASTPSELTVAQAVEQFLINRGQVVQDNAPAEQTARKRRVTKRRRL